MEPLRVYLTGADRDAQAEVADWLRRRHGFVRVTLPGGRTDAAPVGGGDPARPAAMALEHGGRRADLVIDGVRTPVEAEHLRARGVLGVRVAVPVPGGGEPPDGLATVPVDLVLPLADQSLACDRDMRLLVARLAVLHATRATASRVLPARGVWQGGRGRCGTTRTP